jgi:hypothetical protein
MSTSPVVQQASAPIIAPMRASMLVAVDECESERRNSLTSKLPSVLVSPLLRLVTTTLVRVAPQPGTSAPAQTPSVH